MQITINSLRLNDEYSKLFEEFREKNGLTRVAAARML